MLPACSSTKIPFSFSKLEEVRSNKSVITRLLHTIIIKAVHSPFGTPIYAGS